VLKKLANGREFIEAARLAFSGTRCCPNPDTAILPCRAGIGPARLGSRPISRLNPLTERRSAGG